MNIVMDTQGFNSVDEYGFCFHGNLIGQKWYKPRPRP